MRWDRRADERRTPYSVQAALDLLNDPHTAAKAYMAESTPSRMRHVGDHYPYALGMAIGTIRGLLDSLGYSEAGPDRFDCEWSVSHPLEDDECELAVTS